MLFSPVFGILSDRLTARRPVMLVGCLLALAGFVVLLVTGHPWVAVGAALLVSASMAATIPMQVVFASERFRAVGAGTAIGLVEHRRTDRRLAWRAALRRVPRRAASGSAWCGGVATRLGVLRILAVLGSRASATGPRAHRDPSAAVPTLTLREPRVYGRDR